MALKSAFPLAQVHAFEPVEETMSELRRQTVGLSGVDYRMLAMGEARTTGVMELREHSAINSLLPGLDDIAGSKKIGEATVNIDSVDEYCNEHHIPFVHILKTDTEGFDLEVLRGAHKMLQGGRVHLVLSEAGVRSDDRRHTPLSSIMNHLSPLGFYLYCLYDFPLRGCERSREYFNALFVREND